MLENLNGRLRIHAADIPASDTEIADLTDTFPNAPREYLDLLRLVTELELQIDGDGYLRIWAPSGVFEMRGAYNIDVRMPSALPIGDDGGGRVVLYMDGPAGFGLYLSGYGDVDPESAVWLSGSLRSLLVDGRGLEKISE